jgi:hypothetical protein
MAILAYKFKREIHRIFQQLKAIPEFFTEPWKRKHHDLNRGKNLHTHSGQISQHAKIALLLVYQPTGISEATAWTCQHLVYKGYSPLVISNAPMGQDDLRRLLPWSWKLVERPNFGYDFGAYRDGIWLLSQWCIHPEILIILNDSIWFPLDENETLIQRMESSEAQFVGALQLDPLRQTHNVPKKKRPFYGSFFLMAQRGAWVHPAFQAFWANYRMTSNKYKTIRRGERGLSHAMLDAGLRCEAIYTRSALDNYLSGLDAAGLHEVIDDLVTIDESLHQDQQNCLANYADTPAWRQEALALALRMTEKQNVLATAPLVSMTTFDVPYLKKSKDLHNIQALAHIRALIDEGRLPRPHESIFSELLATLEYRP